MAYRTIASPDGHIKLVALAGDVDANRAEEVRSELEPTLAGGCHVLIVDLRAVTFIDRAGLSLLTRVRDEVAARGATMQLLVEPCSGVDLVIELANLHRVFPVHNRLGDAVVHARIAVPPRRNRRRYRPTIVRTW